MNEKQINNLSKEIFEFNKAKLEKCTECPECGCEDYVHKDELGDGYRVCLDCRQEWYTTINYKKYTSPAYFYEVFTSAGRVLPPGDKNGDAKGFDKRSIKRKIKKLVKMGWTVTAFVTKPNCSRELIYSNWPPTGFVNSIGIQQNSRRPQA